MHSFNHPRLQEISTYLTRVRRELADAVHSADSAAMARSSGPDRWSGAQIIQHLGKVEGSTAKYLEGIFAKALVTGLGEDIETSSLMGSLDRFRAGDGALPNLLSPERLVPDAAPPLAENWGSLEAVRERLLRAYATVDGRDLGGVKAMHPRLGLLNAYEWFLFVGVHEERHLGQLRRELAG
jgi:hypothetical protein